MIIAGRPGRYCRLLTAATMALTGIVAVAQPPATDRSLAKFSVDGQRSGGSPLENPLRSDLATLGSEHPTIAMDRSRLAMQHLATNRLVQAATLSAQAVAIVRSRRATALHGGDGPESALARAKAQLNHADPLGFILEDHLAIAWARDHQHAGRGETVRSGAFMAAQDLLGSASAHAMALTAGRSMAGGGALARLLREQQNLSDRVVAIDQRLLARAPADAASPESRALRAELHSDMLRLAGINHRIDRQFTSYRAIISPLPLAIGQARRALKADEGLLLLIASRGDIHSFAIGPRDSAWHVSTGVAPAVAGQIAALHCQVDAHTCKGTVQTAQPTPSEMKGYARYNLALAHALYITLLAPVEAPLRAAQTVYVVTSGFMSDLPLAMLTTALPPIGVDEASPQSLIAAPWLGDRYAFINLPAVSGLRLKAVRAPPETADLLDGYGDPVLAAGDVPMSRGVDLFRPASANGSSLADPALLRALPSLPGTRRELTRMAAVLAAPDAALHLQGRATERELKGDPLLSRAGVIVFATHGVLPGELKDHSEPGLILTPPDVASAEDDGFLTASEASQLTLHAEWLILSACNTAASGGTGGSDSLSALARGFLFAGAHALLASHWRVSDDATAALTVEALTSRHARPPLTGAHALHAAMRTVRTGFRGDGSKLEGWHEDWAHPAAWAAFSYIADRDN